MNSKDFVQSYRAFWISLLIILLALLISGIHPHDRLTWWLEIFPILIVVPLLLFSAKNFPLTGLLYGLIAIHAVILAIGGHYTYERVPIGNWLEHLFHFHRNNYDRIGHFAQGFVPAIALRELLLRTSTLGRSKWLPPLIIASCLGISAFYELCELWSALILGENANNFLSLQGDPWDTQWDMCTALIGTITSLLLLSRWHDRSLSLLRY
jgi:putative membrane protein